MTIAEVSKKYDLTQDTIRYYERIGLIPVVPRTKSGIRNFDDESCKWIEFIKCMRSAGMPIESLIEYVTLFRQGEETIDARVTLLKNQREKMLEKQQDIKNTIEKLEYKIKIYEDIASGKRKDFFSEL